MDRSHGDDNIGEEEYSKRAGVRGNNGDDDGDNRIESCRNHTFVKAMLSPALDSRDYTRRVHSGFRVLGYSS